MDIADVAKRAGMPASTLRFYEKRGLIASVSPQGARRQFAPGVLDQLALAPSILTRMGVPVPQTMQAAPFMGG